MSMYDTKVLKKTGEIYSRARSSGYYAKKSQ